MLARGVYPAAVTPLDGKGRVDMAGVARLLAWFEACGCKGTVLAGTNGEGPSLSAPEKRDLLADAMPLRGKLDLILGIATPSLDEAVWLCKRAADAEASAVLVMPPYYFRDAEEAGIEQWFIEVLSKSPVPVLIYNFPQKTGVTLGADLMGRLALHERFGGLKDSSGNRDNLAAYAQALTHAGSGGVLFVGNEELLIDALDLGWTGTISGAANVVPMWLSQIVREYIASETPDGEFTREHVEAKFELLLPCLSAIRACRQPAMNKALLQRLGVIPSSSVRPPLTPPEEAAVDGLEETLRSRLGLRFGDPAPNCPALSAP